MYTLIHGTWMPMNLTLALNLVSLIKINLEEFYIILDVVLDVWLRLV